MSILANIHNKRLLQKFKNYCRSFLHSLEMFQGRLVVVPLFYLYSYYTNNSSHKILSCANSLKIAFGATYVSTTKNCINFLCKNDFEFLPLADC